MSGTHRVAAAATITNPPTEPLFVSIRSRNFDQWFTDGFVPWQHVFGDGNRPGYLPVEWVIHQNDALEIQIISYSTSSILVNFGVWGILRSFADEAKGVYA